MKKNRNLFEIVKNAEQLTEMDMNQLKGGLALNACCRGTGSCKGYVKEIPSKPTVVAVFS